MYFFLCTASFPNCTLYNKSIGFTIVSPHIYLLIIIYSILYYIIYIIYYIPPCPIGPWSAVLDAAAAAALHLPAGTAPTRGPGTAAPLHPVGPTDHAATVDRRDHGTGPTLLPDPSIPGTPDLGLESAGLLRLPDPMLRGTSEGRRDLVVALVGTPQPDSTEARALTPLL